MSRRTIVGIEDRGDGTLGVKLVRVQGGAVQKLQPLALDLEQVPTWTQPGAVKEHGRMLRETLEGSHEEVKKALERLRDVEVDERHSLYFLILADEAERLSWESLCDDQGRFLALDPRWPIARMADSGRDHPETPRVFSPPLKAMAVLSALNRDAAPQWKRLYKAVERARKNGLDIVLATVVGQETLHDAILEEIQKGTVVGVELSPMPGKVNELEVLMKDFKPHILHFFCHGSASSGEPWLELATFNDEGGDTSSVVIDISTLMNMRALRNAWLVTLNCCEGGKAAELHSMAYRLVADGGVPVAVGMMEPIDVTDAHEFCGAFYPAVFDILKETLDATEAGGFAELSWAEALQPSRVALSNNHQPATDNRQWTLPVFYVQPRSFQLQKAIAVDAVLLKAFETMRKRAETVAGSLRALPPETPAEVRQQILALLADIPVEMRPDQFGNFSVAGG